MRCISVLRPRGAMLGLAVLGLLAAPSARAQVKLEYKYPEGQRLTYKTTVKTSQILSIAGQMVETEDSKTVISSKSFGKKRADGTQPIVEKIESMASELSLPGGIHVSFDSKDPNAKIDNPALTFLNDVYKVTSQAEYTVVLGPDQQVKAVEGTEKILEATNKLPEQAKATLQNVLSEKSLKDEFQQGHRILPDVLAKQGEPWERTETLALGGGQTMTFTKKYEYMGTEKQGDTTLDKIQVKATEVKYAMDANAQSPLKVVKSDLKVDSGDGVILFDREAGRIYSSKAKTRIKGPMTFEAGGQEIPGDLDLTFDTSTELQPAK